MSKPLVKIQQGSLKGTFVDGEFGQFMTFSGIPYAEPPVGNLRFKDPQPPKSWKGIRDASKEGGVAPQYEHQNTGFFGQDDCLYLNVSTNNLTGRKPVMVWIHGGAFKYGSGSADLQRPDYFMQHDIVFVSINYRLGMLGFLNMDREDCSGNQGLKDQVFALKWVQKNIGAFGGNKRNVTLFGESAGSISVHYHCISPLSKGLFHKAIAQSGVGIGYCGPRTSNKEYAMKIAAELGCSSTNDDDILNFLCLVSAEKILLTQFKIFDDSAESLAFFFVPSLDIKCPNPFLAKPMSEMIEKEINVPLIIGYTSHEAIFTLAESRFETEEDIKKFNDEFEQYLAKDLNIDVNVASRFSTDVKQFYFGQNKITKLQQDNYIQYRGDILFVACIWQVLEKQLNKKTPKYLYKFFHYPEVSLQQVYLKDKVKGACHGDDVDMMFYKSSLPTEMQLQEGTEDYLVMQRMTKMWTDFAKTGNPTPKTDEFKKYKCCCMPRMWTNFSKTRNPTPETDELIKYKWFPYNSDKKCCLKIVDDFKTEYNFQEKSWKLWKPIFEKYTLY